MKESVTGQIDARAGECNNSVIEEIKVAEQKMRYGCFCVDSNNLMQDMKKLTFIKDAIIPPSGG